MTLLNNPFVTSGYIAPEYFCDRERETEELLRWLVNENNVAIISTRRMGKTGLIQHCFHLKEIKENYYTFLIDIYATKTLREFVFQLGKVILATLKPKGQKAWELFVNSLVSLKAGFSLDMSGMPQWNLELGDIKSPETTLDEIFHYLAVSDKPCIIAIDEFQQVAQYPEKNTEALLRTYVQHCDKAHFIFAGSQRHLMGEMFISPARPFYQKNIDITVFDSLYNRFEGITWYLQKILNILFAMTPKGEVCGGEMIEQAVDFILDSYSFTYSELLYQLPEKQKELMIAICKEGKATALTSGKFIHKYSLPSSSSVQSALRGLLEKDFITKEGNFYMVYDRFFSLWLRRNF